MMYRRSSHTVHAATLASILPCSGAGEGFTVPFTPAVASEAVKASAYLLSRFKEYQQVGRHEVGVQRILHGGPEPILMYGCN